MYDYSKQRNEYKKYRCGCNSLSTSSQPFSRPNLTVDVGGNDEDVRMDWLAALGAYPELTKMSKGSKKYDSNGSKKRLRIMQRADTQAYRTLRKKGFIVHMPGHMKQRLKSSGTR